MGDKTATIWTSAKWRLGLLGEGKMCLSFFLPQPQTPIVHDAHLLRSSEIVLPDTARQALAEYATRTNNLLIQGNPKADFLE
jgi:hypothetical protein